MTQRHWLLSFSIVALICVPLLAWGAPVIGGLVFVGARRIWRIGIDHHRSTGT